MFFSCQEYDSLLVTDSSSAVNPSDTWMELCWRTFVAQMIFEKHLRCASSAAAQRLGVMRKFCLVFHDRSLLLRSFWSFVLPVLEYCSNATQCRSWSIEPNATQCLCRMCRRRLLVVLWLAVEILSTSEPLSPSQCLFGTILVTLCLMVWDWQVLTAEPMLSCWPILLFLFVSYYFLFFFLPWVVFVGWGLRIDRVFSLSPLIINAAHSTLYLESWI